MATKKKSSTTRRPSISAARPRSYSELYKADKSRTAPVVAKSAEVATSTQSMDLRQEYAYVIRDLRTLGIVSAALFGIIIIIGFFL
jgi:hypothetical protein